MAINDNILIKIREMKDNLTPVERMVAEYILANTEEIPHLSIKSLAQLSKTSDASVLRFCKTMGYSGYRNFIVSISAALGSIDEEQKDVRITSYNVCYTKLLRISSRRCSRTLPGTGTRPAS